MDTKTFERFQTKYTVLANGCWQWHGTMHKAGYGTLSIRESIGIWTSRLAHRLSYEHFVSPIPDGLTLDHLCRNRACINPAHLEPVTLQENKSRGFSPVACNARKTHCASGHEFTPENTRIKKGGGRDCRACHRQQVRARKAALRKVMIGPRGPTKGKFPRYITYDRKQPKRPYRVSAWSDQKANYIGHYATLDEALAAREEYCSVHGIEIIEKGQGHKWPVSKSSSTTY